MAMKKNRNPLWKVVLMDVAGVCCLLIVPFLGPVPGPGGIPLLLAGLGLLAANHDWADNAIQYVGKHSSSMREIMFPNKPTVKLAWDFGALLLAVLSVWLNSTSQNLLLDGVSIGIMTTATGIFVMNRKRLDWLAKAFKRLGKR